MVIEKIRPVKTYGNGNKSFVDNLCTKNQNGKYNVINYLSQLDRDNPFVLDEWCDDLTYVENDGGEEKISYLIAKYKNGDSKIIFQGDIINDAVWLTAVSEAKVRYDDNYEPVGIRLMMVETKDKEYYFYYTMFYFKGKNFITKKDRVLIDVKYHKTTEFDNVYGLNDLFIMVEKNNKYAIIDNYFIEHPFYDKKYNAYRLLIKRIGSLPSEYINFISGWYDNIDFEYDDDGNMLLKFKINDVVISAEITDNGIEYKS